MTSAGHSAAEMLPRVLEKGPPHMRELSRVAIVDHLSAGGVSRFLLALLTHLAQMYPATTFTYFVSRTNIERDDLVERLAPYENLVLYPLEPPANAPGSEPQRGPLVRAAIRILRRWPWLSPAMDTARWLRSVLRPQSPEWWRYSLPAQVVDGLAEFDVVYFGWPYFCEPVMTRTPIVGTFHDFHFRRFPEAYGWPQRELVERQTRTWLSRCTTAISSTMFIRDELLAYYGDVAPRTEVIYLAPYGFHRPSPERIRETLDRLGVSRPFALFSGGRSAHKNFVRVIEAIGILKRRGTPVHLAVTGLGADVIGIQTEAPAADPIHEMNRLVEEYDMVRGVDYFPLGYVANDDVDALTAGADVVVSASLYEAGCGPAMDGWQAGVPVAFSAIPPFLEQVERFDVRAWVFDPLDANDIADKIAGAVFDVAASNDMVARSLHAFDRYTWDDVAREYYRVLSEAADRGAPTLD